MKNSFAALFACFVFSIHAADTAQHTVKSYHTEIAEFVAFFTEKHPTPVKPTLKDSKKRGKHSSKKITLRRANSNQIETCLQALRQFNWENGKREDAPEGSKLAGRHAQFLALANKKLNVVHQEVDDDGNLITTLNEPICVEIMVDLYSQVPGTQGLVAELPSGRYILKHWNSQEIKEMHAS